MQDACDERILLFLGNPFHPLLNNHALGGEYAGCRSINITGDCRAIYFVRNNNIYVFIAIGSHSELYE